MFYTDTLSLREKSQRTLNSKLNKFVKPNLFNLTSLSAGVFLGSFVKRIPTPSLLY